MRDKADVALFEDELWQNFAPLTLTKATFDVVTGARTVFELHKEKPKILLVRRYLEDVTKERHPQSTVNPDSVDGDTIFCNGLLDPGNLDRLLKNYKTKKFILTQGKRILAARPSKAGFEHITNSVSNGMPVDIKKIEAEVDSKLDIRSEKDANILSQPWEIIRDLKESLNRHIAMASKKKRNPIKKGVKVLGKGRVTIEDGTRIEEGTVLDTTEGDIFIGKSAVIAPSRIIGPTYIGSMTQVKQFSIIAESCIGKNCRIAGEIELSIVSDYTNKAHLGFLGHSYVGEWVNIGASTNTSDLKMTYGDIKVNGIDGTTKIDTGINKLGSFLGDMSKTSIGTLLFSGRRIGVSSHLYGFVTEDVPSFTIYGKGMNAENVELELESSMKTQRKMMARRNIAMTQAYEKMVKHVFELTAEERKRSSVANKKFNL